MMTQWARTNPLRREAERAGDRNELLERRLLQRADAIDYAYHLKEKAAAILAGTDAANDGSPMRADDLCRV